MTERTPLAPVSGLKRTGRLPSPPPRTGPIAARATALDAASGNATDIAAAPPARTTESRPKRSEAPTKRRSTEVDSIRALGLSLPLHLVESLKAHAKATGTTHADVLLDAILEHRGRLDQLLEEAKPHTRTDALFVRTPVKRRKNQTFVSFSVRMPSCNIDTIDALVAEHHADSRSQLCAAALAAYLNCSEPQ